MINSHPGEKMPFSFNNESPFCFQMRIQLERWQAETVFLKKNHTSVLNDLRSQADKEKGEELAHVLM